MALAKGAVVLASLAALFSFCFVRPHFDYELLMRGGIARVLFRPLESSEKNLVTVRAAQDGFYGMLMNPIDVTADVEVSMEALPRKALASRNARLR